MGMLNLNLPGGWPFELQYWYARITGAGGSFGFFSPNVPREVDVSFSVEMPSGEILHQTLQETANAEVNARMGNMIRLLAGNFKRDDIVRSVAASLTADVFRKYPEAKTITMTAELIRFPTMTAYNLGNRPERLTIYSAKFSVGSLQ